MKRVFLLIVVPALLTALGFAQTPTASSNTDQINVKGCLGGFDGNYTVVEDNTGQIVKITTSSADLKPLLGHNVRLIGHRAGGAVSSGTAENSLAVTEVNMISEHCTAAAAASATPSSTPSETTSTPAAAAAAPAAAPTATVSTSAETVSTTPAAEPATTSSTPSETTSIPVAAAVAPTAAPAAAVSTSAETVSTTPAAAAVQPTPPSARPRKLSATPAATAAPAGDCQPHLSRPHPLRLSARLRRLPVHLVQLLPSPPRRLGRVSVDVSFSCRGGAPHRPTGPSFQQVEKTKGFAAGERPKSLFYE